MKKGWGILLCVIWVCATQGDDSSIQKAPSLQQLREQVLANPIFSSDYPEITFGMIKTERLQLVSLSKIMQLMEQDLELIHRSNQRRIEYNRRRKIYRVGGISKGEVLNAELAMNLSYVDIDINQLRQKDLLHAIILNQLEFLQSGKYKDTRLESARHSMYLAMNLKHISARQQQKNTLSLNRANGRYKAASKLIEHHYIAGEEIENMILQIQFLEGSLEGFKRYSDGLDKIVQSMEKTVRRLEENE